MNVALALPLLTQNALVSVPTVTTFERRIAFLEFVAFDASHKDFTFDDNTLAGNVACCAWFWSEATVDAKTYSLSMSTRRSFASLHSVCKFYARS